MFTSNSSTNSSLFVFVATAFLAAHLHAADLQPPYVVKSLPGVEKFRFLPGPGNPRNSEGDFLELKDGRVMFVYTHFTGGGGDHSTAHLAARFSPDQGKSWSSEDVTVLRNPSGLNVMSVSLLRLKSGEIALFYLAKNTLEDCRPQVKFSSNEGQTWSEPITCIAEPGYNVLNNDRAVQLKSGRLILPVAKHDFTGPRKAFNGKGEVRCHVSDDLGRTWQPTAMVARGADITLQEPGLVELKNGDLMMFARTPHGSQYVSFSQDQGENWSEFGPSNIISPLSPATIERIPETGDLLMAWNNHDQVADEYKNKRTPFNLAISQDEGQTWTHVRTVEDDVNGWYCYTAMDFVGGNVLLGHCAGDRRSGGLSTSQITTIPLTWIYDKSE